MGFLDHKGGADYPYSKEDVWKALLEAVPIIKGMKVDNIDELSSRIMVKTGISLMTMGENIPITVTEISSGRTRIDVTSTSKIGILGGGLFDFGKSRANIEKILNETSKILSKKPATPTKTEVKSERDAKERLGKLKALLVGGLITEEDYEKRKAEILSQI